MQYRPLVRLPLVIALFSVSVVAGCGDDDEAQPTTSPTQPPTAEAPPAAEGGDDPAEPEDGESDAPEQSAPAPDRPSAAERAAVRAVRDYVAALDARDGAVLCSLLAPGVIDEIALPRRRGDCAASLRASIGYRDPRGLPVFEAIRVAEIPALEVNSDSARLVVTTVTEFADREEPSIEDDVVYLEQSDGRWLIAKPSSSLYRAVGIGDVPPSVLAPPPG